ncbi:MAG: hypothetical protein ACRDSP_10165 [Pseudonocardiaceae bacterium]
MEPPGVVSQTENERGRLVVDGRRTDDCARCALVVVHEVSGSWCFYPHGASQLGVRLSEADALVVANAILAGVR